MEPERFDGLVRLLNSRITRRAAAAVALAAATGSPVTAKRKRKRRVVALGAKCSPSSRCRTGTCQRNICACGAGERRCGERCTPIDTCCTSADCPLPPNTSQCTQPKCQANGACGLAPLPAGIPCGTGDAEICNGSGHCVARTCATDADCPSTRGFCRLISCIDRICTATPRSFGTPIPAQTPGDCMTVVCDGAGGTTFMQDPLDLPANANPCVSVTCDAGSIVRGHLPAGTDCGSGRICNGQGLCS